MSLNKKGRITETPFFHSPDSLLLYLSIWIQLYQILCSFLQEFRRNCEIKLQRTFFFLFMQQSHVSSKLAFRYFSCKMEFNFRWIYELRFYVFLFIFEIRFSLTAWKLIPYLIIYKYSMYRVVIINFHLFRRLQNRLQAKQNCTSVQYK